MKLKELLLTLHYLSKLLTQDTFKQENFSKTVIRFFCRMIT